MMTFKKFSVRHDRVAMKVGTDGVLLGAWTSVTGARRILDIGTGSGLIALMMAQRTDEDVLIDGIEVSDDAEQAKENFELSPWSNRLRIFHNAIQEFNPKIKYDLLVSNPPYFVNALKPPNEKRKQVRHVVTMDHRDILVAAGRLLSPSGRISLILPPLAALGFREEAGRRSLHCLRECSFRTRPHKEPLRYLLEFSYEALPARTSGITLYCNGNEPSEEYCSLTRDFYLKF